MHRRYVEGYCKSSSRRKIGIEHSTYCGRNLVCDQHVSQYSIGLRTYHFWHRDCHGSGQYWLWCIDQFYILFWIRLESGTAYCLSWRYLHWFDIGIASCVVDTEHREVYSLQVMRTQLETLGEEFKLAGKYLMERTYYALRLGPWDALALWGQWSYLGILFVWEFLWWDVSVL